MEKSILLKWHILLLNFVRVPVSAAEIQAEFEHKQPIKYNLNSFFKK
jgi:hypothetical protein